MPSVDIDILSVIVAAIVNMVVGSFWYSPLGLGKAWAKASGHKPGEMGNGNLGYAITAVGSLVMGWILANFVVYAGSNTFAKGVVTGFWLWVGLIAITTAVNNVFSGGSWKLWKINAGYWLVVLLINGGLLAAWN